MKATSRRPTRLPHCLENLHGKYAITAETIETKRAESAVKLSTFLRELGYA